MLVPSRGWTGYLHHVENTARFVLLGPFHPGQILDRLLIHWRTSSNAEATFGAVITPAAEANAGTWSHGVPIVGRSDLAGDGQPLLSSGSGNNNSKSIVVAIGVAVGNELSYVVCRAQRSTGTAVCDFIFSMFCVSVQGVAKGDGSE